MKSFLFISVMALILTYNLQAQNFNCVNSTPNAHIVAIFGNAPKLNGNPLPNGSHIIAVFNSGDTLRCNNFVTVNGSNLLMNLIGRDGADPGYATSEPLKFRVILPNGTRIENSQIQVDYRSGDPSVFTSNAQSFITEFNVSSTSSTKAIENEPALLIYPNPTDGTAFVRSDDKLSEVTIMNVAGQEQVTQLLDNSIDMSNFNPGVYFVKGRVNNVPFLKKLVLIK